MTVNMGVRYGESHMVGRSHKLQSDQCWVGKDAVRLLTIESSVLGGIFHFALTSGSGLAGSTMMRCLCQGGVHSGVAGCNNHIRKSDEASLG
jgi:hypothetical protein